MVLLDLDVKNFNFSDKDITDIGSTLSKYIILDPKRTEYYVTSCLGHLDIPTTNKDKETIEFIKNLDNGEIQSIINYLVQKNKGTVLVNKSTIILMDATGSMASLLDAAKNTVCLMFDRAYEVLLSLNYPTNLFDLQFAVYRNYNATNILEFSTFTSKPAELRDFMKGIKTNGGLGPEAVEIGLWHVNQETSNRPISQVLLIGDAPAQTKQESIKNRNKYRSSWENKPFKDVNDYLEQLGLIKQKNIPIHSFFLNDTPKVTFTEISDETHGTAQPLDITTDPTKAAELLCDKVTKQILMNIDPIYGPILVEKYIEKFTYI